MDNLILLLAFGLPVLLLLLGFSVGYLREQRHLRDLDRREAQFADLFVTQVKSFPAAIPAGQPPCLLFGEVVIGADYGKTFVGGLRKIFGGEIGVYQTMITRARREATLRILEQARQRGYNAVCNLRIQAADIGGNSVAAGAKKGLIMAVMLASGTAYQATPSADRSLAAH